MRSFGAGNFTVQELPADGENMAELPGECEGAAIFHFVHVAGNREKAGCFEVAEKNIGTRADADGPVVEKPFSKHALGLGECGDCPSHEKEDAQILELSAPAVAGQLQVLFHHAEVLRTGCKTC